MELTSEAIVMSVAAEIGPEACHFRRDRERLYLSGLEIAAIIGTGAVLSFMNGIVNGVKMGLSKEGARLGESIVEMLSNRLQALLTRLRSTSATSEEDVSKSLPQFYSDIDQLINTPGIRDTLNDTNLRLVAVEHVTVYLVEVGYPEDIVSDRAEHIVMRIREGIGRWE